MRPTRAAARAARRPRGGQIVTSELRWRIVALQALMVLVLGFCAGFLFWGSGFVNGMVHDQLVAPKISFPPASEIRTGGALDPALFPAEIPNYAGQAVDNGDKARREALRAHDGSAPGLSGACPGPRGTPGPTRVGITRRCWWQSEQHVRRRPTSQTRSSKMNVHASDIEVLSDRVCRELLRSHRVGRIALVDHGQPLIFPVNYAADDRALVFRTAPGIKLAEAPMSRVAFEIDEVDVAA